MRAGRVGAICSARQAAVYPWPLEVGDAGWVKLDAKPNRRCAPTSLRPAIRQGRQQREAARDQHVMVVAFSLDGEPLGAVLDRSPGMGGVLAGTRRLCVTASSRCQFESVGSRQGLPKISNPPAYLAGVNPSAREAGRGGRSLTQLIVLRTMPPSRPWSIFIGRNSLCGRATHRAGSVHECHHRVHSAGTLPSGSARTAGIDRDRRMRNRPRARSGHRCVVNWRSSSAAFL